MFSNDWTFPTAIRFGVGRINELAAALTDAGIEKPLLVTESELADRPTVQSILDLLRNEVIPFSVFSEIPTNPSTNDISAGTKAFHDGGHDGVIAIGGRAALDSGKAIALMKGQYREMWEFENTDKGGLPDDSDDVAPIIAIPTTAGCGSEVSDSCYHTDGRNPVIRKISHPLMMPKIVIADAELATGTPSHIIASSGMDALSNCLEAYCAPAYHPMIEGMAVEGIRLVLGNLAAAFGDASDMNAQQQMLSASVIGGTAAQKGTGAIHALSLSITSLFNTTQDMARAMLIPYVLQANRQVIEDKIIRLSAWLGLEPNFDSFLNDVLDLRKTLMIPQTLSALGVDDDASKEIADLAVADLNAKGNPQTLSYDLALDILSRARDGRI